MAGPAGSRRPRLSLQTKALHHGPGIRTRTSLANADPKSPTAFNTLSNVYVTAIERSTPTQSTPVTAVKLHQPLKIRTDLRTVQNDRSKAQTQSPGLISTPLTPNPISPVQRTEVVYPSTMTPTPPLSAGLADSGRKMFTFTPMDLHDRTIHSSPTQTRARVSFAPVNHHAKAPYSRNKSLHSILRNSPLQSFGAKSPISPRTQPTRRQKKELRRVGYESPLTRTIITEKYTKSHIDLLAEDASPYTPSPVPEDADIDITMAYSEAEKKDGGRTPGPFEEMRRRMTTLATETPIVTPRTDGIRKRRRKEKKRKWVWTLSKDNEETENGAMVALRVAAGESYTRPATTTTTPELIQTGKTNTPSPSGPVTVSVKQTEPESDLAVSVDRNRMDIDISELSSFQLSRARTPYILGVNPITPTTNRESSSGASSAVAERHLTPADPAVSEASSRRDTPVPPGLAERSGGAWQL
ncbi:hypothetical protein F4802DRAFT_440045 [Xylaria palmicola]|nr:hypothetical protein F4802DRAFT_440045 [Xylaria palmicola]